MKMIRLESSNVARIGYDANQLILVIEFLDGSVYKYSNVPENIYQDFLKTDSPGRFVHRVITPNFKYRKI